MAFRIFYYLCQKFLRMDYANFPFTLAHPLEQYEAQKSSGNYSKAMNYALDFFEISTQYLTVLLLGLIRERYSIETANSHISFVVSRIDAKRPLSFGDWANDLLPRTVQAARELIPDEPLTQAVSALSNKKRNLLLGGKKEASIVQIRNEYKGHSTTLAESIYMKVLAELEPRMEEMTTALAPLANLAEKVEEGHFYIERDGQQLADLYPVVHANDKGYIYVFQSLKDEDVAFISSDEHAVTFISPQWNPDFDRWMQHLLPSFDIAKEANWDELREQMRDYSSEYLRHMYSEKKYNQELFVEREQLALTFAGFRQSASRFLPLPGEAGQGKTTQLCHWTEQLLHSDDGVVTFASTEFATGNLDQKLRDIFGLSYKKKMPQFLLVLNEKAVAAGQQIIIFFDALNEVLTYPGTPQGESGPLALYKDIYALFGSAELTAFRIVFTCRSYTWQNELRPEQKHQDMDLFCKFGEEETAVRSFTDEEAERAYAIYHELYQMETPFADLERKNVIRIKNPLILKIVCTNYLGKELPKENSQYTSIALFRKMTDDIRHSYAGNRQMQILYALAEVMLYDYENGTAQDSLLLDDLQKARFDADAPLHKAANLIYNDKGTTIAFEELLNKPERPVLRLIKDEKIQFIYERFLEYMLALAYFQRETQGKAEQDPITAGRIVETMKTAALNEVFMCSLRNVLIMDYLRTNNPQTIIDLAGDFSDNFEVLTLVSDLLNTLVSENFEALLFPLLKNLFSYITDEQKGNVEAYNQVWKTIEKNKADDETIRRYNALTTSIMPLTNRKRLATGTLVNGVLFTDYHNESLYDSDPYELFDLIMDDPMMEIRDNALLMVYYASNKTHTTNYTPMRENITQQVVRHMYDYINATPLTRLANAKRRKRVVTFLESGTRINVLLIIDKVLEGHVDGDRSEIRQIFDDITKVAKHMTANFTLIRILMPFVQVILRRQFLFQSDYVNNLIEYQTFWEDNIVPKESRDGEWCRADLAAIAPCAYLFSKQGQPDAPTSEDFRKFIPKIISAYRTGDSLSYFALERILVIAGMVDYANVQPILQALRSGSITDSPCFDYSQMSFIYVLYQLGLKLPELPDEVADMLEEWCIDWTLRCRGWFKGHNSYKASRKQLYKRNVMTWYAMVYCVRHGDERDPSKQSVRGFRRLIDQAIATRDKELLVHLLNNISELVADSGFIYTSLDLLESVMQQIPSQQILDELEQNANPRYAETQESIITLIGKILGTAKNYFPQHVNAFLTKDVISLTFPGIEKYKDEILGYNPGGERLSDLFTHKFGNMVIYTLIHEEVIDDVAVKALQATVKATGSYKWFEEVVKIGLNTMFNLRL